MHCHLLVSGFFPVADTDRRFPFAEMLLAKGRRKRLAPCSQEAWLFERFSVSARADGPVAPYTLLADGGAPENEFWMRADPVHLSLAEDSLAHAAGGAFGVSGDEAQALVEAINRHFSPEMLFFAPATARWYLRLPHAPDLETSSPTAAAAGPLADHFPRGPDALRFLAIMNESQMIFHEHPVNAARAARGVPPVNSVWLWGGGRLGEAKSPSIRIVLSDEALARGLALATGLPAQPLPRGAEGMLAGADPSGVVLAVLGAPAGLLDPDWPDVLERDWFAPLVSALRRGRIGMLTLSILGAECFLETELVRSDLRRFWRINKPVACYVA